VVEKFHHCVSSVRTVSGRNVEKISLLGVLKLVMKVQRWHLLVGSMQGLCFLGHTA